MMVSPHLTLLAANASACRLLACANTLLTRDGALRCAATATQVRLGAAIDDLLRAEPRRTGTSSVPTRSVLRLHPLKDRSRTLVLQMFALQRSAATPGVALVLVHDLAAPPLPDPQALAQVFGLTPGELRVAHQLAAGASAQDIARSHGVAVSTVRCQIRVLFDKVGVRRQAELVATLAALPARQHPP